MQIKKQARFQKSGFITKSQFGQSLMNKTVTSHIATEIEAEATQSSKTGRETESFHTDESFQEEIEEAIPEDLEEMDEELDQDELKAREAEKQKQLAI